MMVVDGFFIYLTERLKADQTLRDHIDQAFEEVRNLMTHKGASTWEIERYLDNAGGKKLLRYREELDTSIRHHTTMLRTQSETIEIPDDWEKKENSA